MRRQHQRNATAVTEFAMVAPFLVLILLGAIDVGQSINVAQVVNDASREGARIASRADVNDLSDVSAAVSASLAKSFPKTSSQNLNSAVTVTVSDASGTVPGGDLSTVASGDPISVQVIMQYDAVRWTIGFAGLTDGSIETTTTMRRE